MSISQIQGKTVPIHLWAPVQEVESKALDQLKNIAALPWVFKHVAAMPDMHYGIGATVGSVIAMKDAVCPAAVGVDIGCFVGETKVPLLSGRQRSLKDLSGEPEPFWVYSMSAAGRIVPGRARCVKTRVNAELMRVVVSGGDEIVCTPDHQFMMNDGTYREARDLRFNDSLKPLYRRWQTRDGYESVNAGTGSQGSSQQTHTMTWEALNEPVPPGYVVHHKNHVHFDNRPENLELMTISEHSAHHRTAGRKFDNDSPAFQRLRLAGIGRRADDPVARAQMAKTGTENIVAFMRERPEEFRAAVEGNGRRGAPVLSKFNVQPRACSDCDETAANPASLRWHKKRTHGYNHKVILTEQLERREDVYCLQVEEHHNFALAAGVFVHNCGMMATKTSLKASDLPDSLSGIRSKIEAAVPVNFNGHDKVSGHVGRLALWEVFGNLHEKAQDLLGKAQSQVGTLGGGNHFIELCLDTEQNVWVMLHSGSRNIGKVLAEIHISAAKKLIHNAELPDKDLAAFLAGTPEMEAYKHDLNWAQRYAFHNREVMLRLVLNVLVDEFAHFTRDSAISCHHNYLSEETHFGETVLVTRKGAISARAGELGIIPGSMGTRSYIVRGLGNPESFHSASHGAGRRMSRGQAKRAFTLEDFAAQTAGVECRKDAGVIDEIPGAYKDIDSVMRNQADLVEVVAELKQVLCVKG